MKQIEKKGGVSNDDRWRYWNRRRKIIQATEHGDGKNNSLSFFRAGNCNNPLFSFPLLLIPPTQYWLGGVFWGWILFLG